MTLFDLYSKVTLGTKILNNYSQNFFDWSLVELDEIDKNMAQPIMSF